MIVLDTNVISEFMRPVPAPLVLEWSRRLGAMPVTTTAVNEAEIRAGIATIPLGRRRAALAEAAERMFVTLFSAPVLVFDSAAAAHYARFVAARLAAGRRVQSNDAMIAATALAHGATAIATRDIDDFQGCGVPLINPWDA